MYVHIWSLIWSNYVRFTQCFTIDNGLIEEDMFNKSTLVMTLWLMCTEYSEYETPYPGE